MLFESMVILSVTVAMGLFLAAVYLKGEAARRLPAWPGWLHGALGVVGSGALILALGGPPRGVASGAGGFGAIAAWFCGFAILLGAVILACHLRRRSVPSLAVVTHAMLGVSGFVMLLAYYAAGS